MTAGRGVVRKSLGSNKEILKLKKGFTGLWLQEDSMSKTLLCVDRIFKGRGSSVHCSKYSLTFLSLNNLNLFKLLSTQIWNFIIPVPCISHAHLSHHNKKICAKNRRVYFIPLGVITLCPLIMEKVTLLLSCPSLERKWKHCDTYCIVNNCGTVQWKRAAGKSFLLNTQKNNKWPSL